VSDYCGEDLEKIEDVDKCFLKDIEEEPPEIEPIAASDEEKEEEPESEPKEEKPAKPKLTTKKGDPAEDLVVTRLKGGGCGVISSNQKANFNNLNWSWWIFLVPCLIVLMIRFDFFNLLRKRQFVLVRNKLLIFIVMITCLGKSGFGYDFSKKYINNFGSRGFVERAVVLKQGSMYISTQGDFARGLLTAETEDNKDFNLVDQSVRNNLNLSFGITDIIQLGFSVPVTAYQKARYLGYSDYDNHFGVSDLLMELKILVLSFDVINWSISSDVSYNKPKKFNFYSGNSWQAGFRTALTSKFKKSVLSFNLGYRYLQTEYIYDIAFNDYINAGIVYSYYILGNSLEFSGGFDGQIQTSALKNEKNAAKNIPVEFNGFITYHVSKRLRFQTGGGLGLTDAYGAPAWRVFAGASYKINLLKLGKSKRRYSRKKKNYFSFSKSKKRKKKKRRKKRKRRSRKKNKVVQVDFDDSHSSDWKKSSYRRDLKRKIQKQYENSDINFDGLD